MPNARNSAWGGTGGDGAAAVIGPEGILVNGEVHQIEGGGADDSDNVQAALDAAPAGATIEWPDGELIAGDIDVPDNGLIFAGTGSNVTGGSRLKAPPGATYVLKIQGKRFGGMRDFVIDGNGRASSGLLIEATALAASQSWLLENVLFYQCLTGLHFGPGAGGINQADKTTLKVCKFVECSVAIDQDASNSQETVLLNTSFHTTQTTDIVMSGGSLCMIGGQFQGTRAAADPDHAKNIEILNSDVDWIVLVDVVFEGSGAQTNIHGSAAWPVNGVTAIATTFQGATANLLMGQASSSMAATACRFNDGLAAGNGQITINAATCSVTLIQCEAPHEPLFDGTNKPQLFRVKNGKLTVGSETPGDNYELLRLLTSRSWLFETSGADGTAQELVLRPVDNGKTFRIEAPDSTKVASFLATNGAAQLSFFGAATVVQQAANADTTGLTLPNLEIEVNQLKQLLRNYGLMAP